MCMCDFRVWYVLGKSLYLEYLNVEESIVWETLVNNNHCCFPFQVAVLLLFLSLLTDC
jgi:hypothetical protein